MLATFSQTEAVWISFLEFLITYNFVIVLTYDDVMKSTYCLKYLCAPGYWNTP